MSAWDDVFESGVPEWLVSFAERPADAVEDLLFQQFFHGHLQTADPVDLLVDWIDMLGERGGFAPRLDMELSAWIGGQWGVVPGRRRSKRWADAWQRVANVVGAVVELPSAAQELRSRFGEAHEYLGPFSTAPSRDPLGRYLWAVAGHQQDRSLESTWWSMCDLADSVPFYHASYAVGGVAGLPPPADREGGGFRNDVVHAVFRLGRSFNRLLGGHRLQPRQAEDEYGVAVNWALSAFPFHDRWCEVLAPLLTAAPNWVRDQLVVHVDGLGAVVKRPPPKGPKPMRWKEPTDQLVAKIGRQPVATLPEARDFLRRARAHAETTGDSKPLNRALCRFSMAIAAVDAEQAREWAEEALSWEPWDAFSWTTLSRAQLEAGFLQEALVTAWRGVERFPQNVVVRNVLAELLKDAQRLEEAETVYRETLERFPEDSVVRSGLGGTLKAAGRLEEAIAVYREALKKFPRNVFLRNGWAETLRAAGRFEEAEAVYRKTLEQAPQDSVVHNGLAGVLKAAGRLDEAEAVLREAAKRFPGDVGVRNGLGEVLKAAGRFDDAEAVYRETLERFPRDAWTRNGLAEVLKAAGRLDDAEALYRETLEEFPQNVVAHSGLAEVLKAAGRLEDAEALYRGSVERYPRNDVLRRALSDLLEAAGREDEARAIQLGPREAESRQEPSGVEPATEAEGEPRPPGGVALPSAAPEEAAAGPTAPPPAAGRQQRRQLPGSRARRDLRTSQARLFRRAARRAEEAADGNGPSAATLRERAAGLLEAVLEERPHDLRALAEKGLVLVDSGASEAGRELLDEQSQRLPAAPLLWMSLGRALRREASDRGRALSADSEADLLAPPSQLQHLDHAYEPLVRLQQGRAFLALTDGDERLRGASLAFERLRRWVTRNESLGESGDFEPWLSAELKRHALAPIDIDEQVRPSQVEAIATCLARSARLVDALEEDFALRFSR